MTTKKKLEERIDKLVESLKRTDKLMSREFQSVEGSLDRLRDRGGFIHFIQPNGDKYTTHVVDAIHGILDYLNVDVEILPSRGEKVVLKKRK